jgi:Flp pilus assembly pilin Flp
MDYIKKFLRDESGAAEAVSSAVMIAMASGLSGIWNGGLSGIWNSLINNPSASILVVFTLVFFLWVIFKA